MKHIENIILLTATAIAIICHPIAVTAQAQFDPTGQWKCFWGQNPSPSRRNQGFTATSVESVVNAHPDVSFQAQGLNHGGLNPIQFTSQGRWTIESTEQGTSVTFNGQSQSSFMGIPQTNPFFAGGIIRDVNNLSYSETNSIGQVSSICERIG